MCSTRYRRIARWSTERWRAAPARQPSGHSSRQLSALSTPSAADFLRSLGTRWCHVDGSEENTQGDRHDADGAFAAHLVVTGFDERRDVVSLEPETAADVK